MSLSEAVTRCGSKAAAARELGIPVSTFKDALAREEEGRGALRVLDGGAGEPPEEIPVIFRDYSHQSRHLVYPLGDVHLGAHSHNGRAWQQWLGFLGDREDASLLGTGDFLNAAVIGSKSEVYDETTTVGKAKRLLRRQLQPLAEADRIDALAPGNHEDRIYRAVGDCPIEDICDSLDLNYIQAAALIVYRVGSQEYELFIRHGTGNGQALAGLSKGAHVITADIYVTGHIHRQALTADDHFVRDGQRVKRVKRYFVSAGSFLGYEKYAAQRGYAPGRIGSPRILLDGERHDVHISL